MDVILLNELQSFIQGGEKTFKNNGTFIVPDGITEIYVTACAAGGSGTKAGSSTQTASGGGGGDAIFCKKFTVTPKQSIPITVGSGDTIIGNLITLQKGISGGSSYDTIAGGSAGGLGGGKGGTGYDSSETTINASGVDGIFGKGGISYKKYGAGGGSLGRGASVYEGAAAGYGGGGASRDYHDSDAKYATAGKGIVFITWGVLSPTQHIQFMNSVNSME